MIKSTEAVLAFGIDPKLDRFWRRADRIDPFSQSHQRSTVFGRQGVEVETL